MSTPFPPIVQLYRKNEKVIADILNRPLTQLDQRTKSLNEQLQGSKINSSLVLYGVTLSGENVKTGSPVWKDDVGVFNPAFAELKLSNDNITYELSDSALPWGVVQDKLSSTTGNVLLYGIMELSESRLLDILLENTPKDGVVFISATPNTEGKLTYRRPPYGVAVGLVKKTNQLNNQGEPVYNFLVCPRWNDPYEDHIHYRANLSTDMAMWDNSFDSGLAPAGALFRYKVEDDDDLNKLWPPIPVNAAHIERDGVTANTTDNDPEIVVDPYGIWWIDYENDPNDYSRIEIYYSRMTFKTSNAVVTSLAPGNDAVKIINAFGDDAKTGDLEISFNFTIDEDVSEVEGLAVKEIEGATVKYGDVVDSLSTSTPQVVQLLGPEAGTGKKGNVEINVYPLPLRESGMSFSELNNVEIESSGGVFYLLLNKNGTMISRFRIPTATGEGEFDCVINLNIWARSAGTMPATLGLDYLIITDVPDVSSPSPFVPSYEAGTISMPTGSRSAGDMFVASGVLGDKVKPGDIVFIRLSRGSDSYGNIGIVDQWWSLEV